MICDINLYAHDWKMNNHSDKGFYNSTIKHLFFVDMSILLLLYHNLNYSQFNGNLMLLFKVLFYFTFAKEMQAEIRGGCELEPY